MARQAEKLQGISSKAADLRRQTEQLITESEWIVKQSEHIVAESIGLCGTISRFAKRKTPDARCGSEVGAAGTPRVSAESLCTARSAKRIVK